ncbi:glycoside hydrolase family 79 protein [Roridomyces roridus]|uniref:Glycoside hydrolase family 79 protein n=1 Tax=Roridomyces roridus TaxID=1738132 RepID=A0AAD7BDJ6_9AGAR|nr:glycoside hydrolase family 79 protein [Roridomyces roridus]
MFDGAGRWVSCRVCHPLHADVSVESLGIPESLGFSLLPSSCLLDSPPSKMGRSILLTLFLLFRVGHGAITVYHAQGDQAAFTTAAGSASGASQTGTYSGPAAYNPTSLSAPPLPTASVLTTLPVQLQNSGTTGMSIKQKGSFIGFSIEMSVTNQVLGKNSTLIQVPFLNLMGNIQQRAGSVMVRVGGNTQESAVLVDTLEHQDGRILEKNLTGVTGTTQTPPLDYTRDLLYLMRNISSFVNVHWFLGVPWFVTTPFDTAIVRASDEILGDYLLGLQAGNEPDFYTLHGHRGATYGPYDYLGEFSDFVNQISSDGSDSDGRARTVLIGPNLASFAWTPQQQWDTGFVDQFSSNLAFLAVEKYPADNCAQMFNTGGEIVDPQTELPKYLTHNAPKDILAQYLNDTAFAQTKNKPFLMFETNTASCGGFLGISDSFTAALWGVDYALQLAHSNFSGAMFHLGGQNVFYNPFTSPPTNESSFHQWTVGPLYYSALVMAEAMGASNESQVLDLPIDGISEFTPVYAIYENGVPKRVAIINYLDDSTGAHDVEAVISIGGTTMPAEVKVKYLAATTVVQKGSYTWAGQTFGYHYESDGRPMGDEDIQTVQCDSTAQTCTVKVPAPGMALVFLSDDAQTEGGGQPSVTFATTAKTKTRNTVTADPSVLATSNGGRLSDHELAGTSKPPNSGVALRASVGLAVVGVVSGVVLGLLGRA